ncbi:MAG: hypothetical protein ACOYNS_07460 [Bacteroidota bacterium]
MTRTYPYILLFIIAAVSGCDIPQSSDVIDSQIPPTIVEASIAPTTVDFGKAASSGSNVDVTLLGYVNAADDNGLTDIASVSYKIFTPAGKVFASGSLSDNGIQPDATAGDGQYNSQIVLHLPKEVIGTYSIQFTTIDRSGFSSNIFNLPLKITLSTNNAPSLANLYAPDSVRVPSTADSVNLVYMSISVSDQQGLSDITSVILTSQRPDSSVAGTFYLSDDGGTSTLPQFNIPSGDSVANDGVYSIVIPMFSTTQKNTYRDFIFTARDQSGAISNAVIKRMVIQ